MDILSSVGTLQTLLADSVFRRRVCSGALVLTAVWYITPKLRAFFKDPLSQMPSMPKGSLLYGNMRDYFYGKDMDVYTKWMKQTGQSILRYYHCMGQSRVMVADADAMKHIMVTNCDNYVRPNYVREVFTRGIGENLLFMNGEQHYVHRRLCSQAFRTPVLQKMIPSIQRHSESLLTRWLQLLQRNPDVELDIAEDLSRMASDTIAKCGFGLDMDSLNNPDTAVTNAFNKVSKYKPGPLRFVFPSLAMDIPNQANRDFKKNLTMCDGIISEAMAKKRQLLENGQVEENDILSVLLQARDEDNGQGLSPKQLRDHAMFFFAAGIQNTATCMAWCLLSLAERPEVQERVREEVREHLPAKGEPITSDHLHSLTYLTCVIKETLRFHPVISNFAKQALKDDVINGYKLPAGTIVTLCVDALHRNPASWSNPDVFDPERFLDENATNHAWLPFGAGSKMCLGYKFSLIEMKMTLALLFRDLDFQLGANKTYRKKKCITMFPDPLLTLRATILES